VAISCRKELSLIWLLLETAPELLEFVELLELDELVEFVDPLAVAAIGMAFECMPWMFILNPFLCRLGLHVHCAQAGCELDRHSFVPSQRKSTLFAKLQRT
jgi:hypothetical protein